MSALWPRTIPKELNLSREQARKIHRAARMLRRREPQYRNAHWSYFNLVAPILIPLLAIFIYILVTTRGQSPLNLFVPPAASVLIPLYAWRRTYVPFIRRALCEAGYEVCMECGYLLLALPESTVNCPECGCPRVEAHRKLAASREADEALLQRRQAGQRRRASECSVRCDTRT